MSVKPGPKATPVKRALRIGKQESIPKLHIFKERSNDVFLLTHSIIHSFITGSYNV
jgi:hypothetical protein